MTNKLEKNSSFLIITFRNYSFQKLMIQMLMREHKRKQKLYNTKNWNSLAFFNRYNFLNNESKVS